MQVRSGDWCFDGLYHSGGGNNLPAIRQSFTQGTWTSVTPVFGNPVTPSPSSLTTTYWNASKLWSDACRGSETASTRFAPMARIMRGTVRLASLAFSASDVPYHSGRVSRCFTCGKCYGTSLFTLWKWNKISTDAQHWFLFKELRCYWVRHNFAKVLCAVAPV